MALVYEYYDKCFSNVKDLSNQKSEAELLLMAVSDDENEGVKERHAALCKADARNYQNTKALQGDIERMQHPCSNLQQPAATCSIHAATCSIHAATCCSHARRSSEEEIKEQWHSHHGNALLLCLFFMDIDANS